MRKWLKRVCDIVLVLCVVIVVLRLFGVSVICVQGTSMEPNYGDGELHLVAKSNEYEQGDVVCVRLDDMVILKRIIATEGDVLEVYHHCIWVNNTLVEPYITGEKWNGSGEYDTHQIIGPGEVYLLGDNRNTSGDSRHFGAIKTEQIIGRVIW